MGLVAELVEVVPVVRPPLRHVYKSLHKSVLRRERILCNTIRLRRAAVHYFTSTQRFDDGLSTYDINSNA
jgi:hypothetical protein